MCFTLVAQNPPGNWSAGRKVEKSAGIEPCPFPLSVLCVYSPSRGSSPPNPARVCGMLWVPSCPSEARPTNGFWCILSWKSHSRDSKVLLHKFSDNHLCTVIRAGPVAYQHGVFSKKVVVWFKLKKKVPVWHTIPWVKAGKSPLPGGR